MDLPANPVETTWEIIGNKWKIMILRELMQGTRRFGELKKSITRISQKALSEQLHDLEKKGIVNRQVYAEVPPRVEYSLTETGYSLRPVMDILWAWGEIYQTRQLRPYEHH